MNKRTTSLLAAAAAATTLFGAATAGAAPTVFESDTNGPAAIGAFDGTVLYTSGDHAASVTLKRSIDGGAPTAFSTSLNLTAPVTMDLGPGTAGTIKHPAGTPVAMFRVGGKLVTVRTSNGAVISTLTPSPTPTGDVATFAGRIAYVTGAGKNRKIVAGYARNPAGYKVLAKGNIESLDIGKSWLAYTEYRNNGYGRTVQMHLVNLINGHDQVLGRAGSGAMSSVTFTKPAFTADTHAVIWPETRFGAEGQIIHRYEIKTHQYSQAPGKRNISGSAWAGDDLGLAYSTYDESTADCELPCSVNLTGPLTFSAKR